MNGEAAQALKGIGQSLIEVGHHLVALAVSLSDEFEPPTPAKLPDARYSQDGRDARQHPILSMFSPLDPTSHVELPWHGAGSVTEVAIKNGYTTRNVGALLMAGGLLQWVEAGKTVTITDKGRVRFREIAARKAARPADDDASGTGKPAAEPNL